MEMNQRVCKNKKCQNPLPEGYKYKYCEGCRNKQIENAKNVGKVVLGVIGLVVTTVLTILTADKINPKS